MAQASNGAHGLRPRSTVALIDDDGRPVPDWVDESLESIGVRLVHRNCQTEDEVISLAASAQIVWLFGSRLLTGPVLRKLSSLVAVLRTGSGTDNVAVDVATELGILVCNTPNSYAREVAEHTLALLFAVVRRITIQDRMVKAGIWEKERGMPIRLLAGSTMGMVGLGHIGRIVARSASALGITCVAFDPYLQSTSDAEIRIVASIEELLALSDIVSLHCPLTPETLHLLGEREFALVKPGAIVLNTSRGGLIDEHALIRALNDGRVAAAGLDVTDPEPPRPGNPLVQSDLAVVTPHIAGYSDQHLTSSWRDSIEVISAIVSGHGSDHAVNRPTAPRRPKPTTRSASDDLERR